jgi:hypothetical protein
MTIKALIMYGGVEVLGPVFFISALAGGEWSAYHCVSPEEISSDTH